MGDYKHVSYCLVSTSSQQNSTRKRTAAIIYREDVKYNDITVKWDAGSCTSVQIFLLEGIFSSFSRKEIPADLFVVIKAKCTCVNLLLDTRH